MSAVFEMRDVVKTFPAGRRTLFSPAQRLTAVDAGRSKFLDRLASRTEHTHFPRSRSSINRKGAKSEDKTEVRVGQKKCCHKQTKQRSEYTFLKLYSDACSWRRAHWKPFEKMTS